MLKIERILCPVDFSEFSDRACDYAHSFARHFGAKLFVLHVTQGFVPTYPSEISPSLIEHFYAQQVVEAEERVRELRARQHWSDVEHEVVLEPGLVADTILRFVESKNIDLITMGTHGRRGLDRLVLGSVTERILRTARPPVLAVHSLPQGTATAREEPAQFRKILFCTDFSDNSPRALEYAFLLACKYKAAISLLHVIERSDSGEDLGAEKRQVLQKLDAVVPQNIHGWSTVEPAVLAGKAYQMILEHAAETEADLIVMGVRGRNALDRALFGSTTHRVIQLGQWPVLVVRT
jgi:nucleotide-binding universal stress UspA family protein